MNTFCDWLFETMVISAYDSFFRNCISIALLFFIVFSSQSQRLSIYVHSDPIDRSYETHTCISDPYPARGRTFPGNVEGLLVLFG